MSDSDQRAADPRLEGRGDPDARHGFACRICGNDTGNERLLVREMMLGLREAFPYYACAECGTIQVENAPEDVGKYYPDGYYSKSTENQHAVVRLLKRIRARETLDQPSLIGKALVRVAGPAPIATWMKQAGAHLADRILDVGSGTGQNLLELANIGFRHLHGVDPYIDEDVNLDSDIRIRKATIHDVDGEYDLIMLHHVLEHVADPDRDLSAARNRLSADGKILIRTPVADCFVYRNYASDWVQLDAPRHTHVFSAKAIGLLANRNGMRVESVRYDSDAFQFWGSEQYRMDISLSDSRSHQNSGRHGLFTRAQMKAWSRQAATLNLAYDGDQACFVLSQSKDATA
ncbi:MAG: class I SAM-dependent methyltransferase [Rhodothermales bacterium]|nr:class I SAM-dependent methyltransferase [Rhodothermales bacterium]